MEKVSESVNEQILRELYLENEKKRKKKNNHSYIVLNKNRLKVLIQCIPNEMY